MKYQSIKEKAAIVRKSLKEIGITSNRGSNRPAGEVRRQTDTESLRSS